MKQRRVGATLAAPNELIKLDGNGLLGIASSSFALIKLKCDHLQRRLFVPLEGTLLIYSIPMSLKLYTLLSLTNRISRLALWTKIKGKICILNSQRVPSLF